MKGNACFYLVESFTLYLSLYKQYIHFSIKQEELEKYLPNPLKPTCICLMLQQ